MTIEEQINDIIWQVQDYEFSRKEGTARIIELIEKLERKAFEAGRELHPTKFAYRKYETFEEWKETGK